MWKAKPFACLLLLVLALASLRFYFFFRMEFPSNTPVSTRHIFKLRMKKHKHISVERHSCECVSVCGGYHRVHASAGAVDATKTTTIQFKCTTRLFRFVAIIQNTTTLPRFRDGESCGRQTQRVSEREREKRYVVAHFWRSSVPHTYNIGTTP